MTDSERLDKAKDLARKYCGRCNLCEQLLSVIDPPPMTFYRNDPVTPERLEAVGASRNGEQCCLSNFNGNSLVKDFHEWRFAGVAITTPTNWGELIDTCRVLGVQLKDTAP